MNNPHDSRPHDEYERREIRRLELNGGREIVMREARCVGRRPVFEIALRKGGEERYDIRIPGGLVGELIAAADEFRRRDRESFAEAAPLRPGVPRGKVTP